MGKTRLATHVAAGIGEGYDDGVVFDNCEHVADEVAGLVETIAMGAHGVDLLPAPTTPTDPGTSCRPWGRAGRPGLVALLAVGSALRPRSKIPFETIGAAGALALMASAVVAPACAGVPGATHVVFMIVAAVLLGGAVVFGRAVAGRGVFPLLLLFGLLDVVRFVSAPVGVILTPEDGALRWAASVGWSSCWVRSPGSRPGWCCR